MSLWHIHELKKDYTILIDVILFYRGERGIDLGKPFEAFHERLEKLSFLMMFILKRI